MKQNLTLLGPRMRDSISHLQALRKDEDYPSSVLLHLLPTAHSCYLLLDRALREEPWSQIALYILQSSFDNLLFLKELPDTLCHLSMLLWRR